MDGPYGDFSRILTEFRLLFAFDLSFDLENFFNFMNLGQCPARFFKAFDAPLGRHWRCYAL